MPIQLYTQTVLKTFFIKESILVKIYLFKQPSIWNNGVPSYISLEQYNPGKKSRIFHLITDDK